MLRDLGIANYGNVFVEQGSQSADDPRFCLTTFTEKHHVMTCQNRILDFWDDGIIIADDPGQNTFTSSQHAQQVRAHLFPDGEYTVASLLQVSYSANVLAEGFIYFYVLHENTHL